jgi:hypothetical protein
MIGFRGPDGRLMWRRPGMRGLGFDLQDLMAQAGIQNCSPLDDACNANNESASIAVHNLWATQYQPNPATADLPVPKISLNTNTTGFINQAPGSDGSGYTTISVNGGAPVNDAVYVQQANQQVAQQNLDQIRAGAPQNAATATILSAPGVSLPGVSPAGVVQTKAATAPAPSAGATAPGSPNIVGMLTEGSPSFTIPGTSVSVPSLPWWAWAGGAAAIAYFMSRRGR